MRLDLAHSTRQSVKREKKEFLANVTFGILWLGVMWMGAIL